MSVPEELNACKIVDLEGNCVEGNWENRWRKWKVSFPADRSRTADHPTFLYFITNNHSPSSPSFSNSLSYTVSIDSLIYLLLRAWPDHTNIKYWGIFTKNTIFLFHAPAYTKHIEDKLYSYLHRIGINWSCDMSWFINNLFVRYHVHVY